MYRSDHSKKRKIYYLPGVHDAFYVDNRYKKVPPGGFKSPKLKSLKFLGCSDPSLAGDIALTNSMTTMIASGVHFAKDLVGMFQK